MSTTTPAPTALDTTETPPVPFGRLVSVEWRKALDTRGGFWLLLITGILLALTLVGISLVGLLSDMHGTRLGFSDLFLQIMLVPVSILVPVFAITVVTSEWNQRTALTTFTLEPSRLKVMLAKMLVAVMMAIGTLVIAAVAAAIANLIVAAGQGYSASWSIDAQKFFVTVLVQTLSFLTAFGLGMCLLSTPAAIAIYYVVTLILPIIAYSILFQFFGWFRGLIPWLDFSYASMPWTAGAWPNGTDAPVDGLAWARLASAVVLWLVVPLGIGFRRVLRSEVK